MKVKDTCTNFFCKSHEHVVIITRRDNLLPHMPRAPSQ